MANCNFCGKSVEFSKPMVLAGQKKFVQGAGNGRVWVGEAPSIRYWKTFALLSVCICPECTSKFKKKSFLNNLILFVVSLSYIVFFFTVLIRIDNDIFKGFLALVALLILLAAIVAFIISVIIFFVNLSTYNSKNVKTGDVVLSHYKKVIPSKDIIARVDGETGDFDIINKTKVGDPFIGSVYNYELKLYGEDEIDLIGKQVDSAQNMGGEEANYDARMLFSKVPKNN